MIASVEAYVSAFAIERQREYPEVAAYEARMGYALDPERYEPAAQVLACPLKVNAPNWQHGRILYATARRYLHHMTGPVVILDIGTAKGFSALCLQWALNDSSVSGRVVSVDVLNPTGRERRNTLAELDGLKTLPEILAPWPEAQAITFGHSTGAEWLSAYKGRVHFAFVDGKHTEAAVRLESELLNERQRPGDVIVYDDIQIPGVCAAVNRMRGYEREYLFSAPNRGYAIAIKASA